MPTYVYTCLACGSIISQLRTIATRDDLTTCSKCNLPMPRRLDFGSVEFKGEGFYSNDKKKK